MRRVRTPGAPAPAAAARTWRSCARSPTIRGHGIAFGTDHRAARCGAASRGRRGRAPRSRRPRRRTACGRQAVGGARPRSQPRRLQQCRPYRQEAPHAVLPARQGGRPRALGELGHRIRYRAEAAAPPAGEAPPHRLGRGDDRRDHQALAVRERLPLLPQRPAHAEELRGRRARLPARRAQLVRSVPPGRIPPARAQRDGARHRQGRAHHPGRHLERLPRRLPALVRLRAVPRAQRSRRPPPRRSQRGEAARTVRAPGHPARRGGLRAPRRRGAAAREPRGHPVQPGLPRAVRRGHPLAGGRRVADRRLGRRRAPACRQRARRPPRGGPGDGDAPRCRRCAGLRRDAQARWHQGADGHPEPRCAHPRGQPPRHRDRHHPPRVRAGAPVRVQDARALHGEPPGRCARRRQGRLPAPDG